ncbi:hypothetical protein BS78_04G197900 [Paspalum vaginatum]|nr:hypothetical protein BS78_04G197900 [Paspalum vaginatum]
MADPAASAQPKVLFVTPATAAYDATAVYSYSPPGPEPNLMFTLDDLRGNFVDGIAAQCRGLTLLYDAVAPMYCVVNAATRAATRLPPCEDVTYSSAGLGFDTQAKLYKVMRLFKRPGHQQISCEVYTLGGAHGDRWRPAAGTITDSFYVTAYCAIYGAASNNLPPVLVNGSLHWLIHDSYSTVRPASAAIITFSVTDESFGWVESKPPCGIPLGAHLVELDGGLCMVRDLRHGSSPPDFSTSSSSALEIWKLHGVCWSLDTRIDLAPSGHAGVDFLQPPVIRVLGVVGDGSRSSARKIVMATSDYSVHVYDAMTKNVETILSVVAADEDTVEKSYLGDGRTAMRVSLFTETLARVHRTHQETTFSSPLGKATKEILLRLPAKSVVQSMRVCGQWRKLIEDNIFIYSYSAHKRMEERTRVMIVGKGTGRSFFHFIPLERENRLSDVANIKDKWLDTKVVCSKPCHGLNLLMTLEMNYIYNPSTGFWRSTPYPDPLDWAPWETPDQHAFAIGSKNVGLGFNPLNQEHVAVIMQYRYKSFKSRQYCLTCSVWHCRRGSGSQGGLVPPLPVNNMPPAHVAGVLYWMSDPMLGPSSEYAIVSYDIAMEAFGVISCPPSINVANWSSQGTWNLFVVELGGVLCVVLADLRASELVVWKVDHGDEWEQVYTICLKASPDYCLLSNVVVPLEVDPKNGKILLSTGRKMGFYDPVLQTIDELYDADEILLRAEGMTGASQGAPSTKSVVPLVPMLYEESLASYPRMRKDKFLH